MAKEWKAICKDCGKEFGYSDSAHEVGVRRGLSRPERCPRCRAIHARETGNVGIAYYPVKPAKPRVPTAELEPGWLGKLHHPEREHRMVEVEAEFQQPDSEIEFGIKDEDIIELIEIMREHQITVIEGPTGSGKSTFLPYRLMDPPEGVRPDEFTRYGPIVVTQPRIQATRGVSAFVARALHGSSLGAGFDIGFRHRGAPAMDWRNKLAYVTDGTLLNWIISGRIANFSVIMIDEAHERSLNIDLILGLLKDHLPRYPNLRLLISSATINPALFIRYFGRKEAGMKRKEVKLERPPQEEIEALAKRMGIGYKMFAGLQRYEVRTFFRPEDQKLSLNPWGMPVAVAKEVISILRDIARGKRKTESGEWELVPEGDILAFLHGEEAINEAVAKVRLWIKADDLLCGRGIEVLPLYTRLPLERQDYALRKKSETIRLKVVHTLRQIADGEKEDGDILALLLDNSSAEECADKIRRSLEEEGFDGTEVHLFPVDEETGQPKNPQPPEAPQGERTVVVSTHEGEAHLNPVRFQHVVVDRRVVISTNVAETSLTVDGIVYVVDSGLITQRHWDPETSTESFPTVEHSQAGCRQRWGRAGRVRDGEAHCLYTESQYEDFPPYTQPEIKHAPLEQIVLTANAAGVDDVVHFDWIQPPSLEELERAQRALIAKGGVDEEGNLTDHGLELRYFLAEPDVANLLIMADRFLCAVEMATLIPMMRLKVRGSLLRWNPKWDAATWTSVRRIHRGLMAHCRDDIEFFLKLYAAWEGAGSEKRRKEWAERYFVNHEEMMTRVFEPREELLDELSMGKKWRERRPIDFDLIDRVRMLWAYCWPEWSFQRIDGEGPLYMPVHRPPWEPEGDISPVRIEIDDDSVCSGRPPSAFVCAKRRALGGSTGEEMTLRVSFLAEMDPEWPTSLDCPLLSFAQYLAQATREERELRQTHARERLFLDQVYPLGSRYKCRLVEAPKDDVALLEIGEQLSPPPEVEESFPEGEIVWETELGEGPGPEIEPTAGSDPDIIPSFDPESEESPQALMAYSTPVGKDSVLRILQVAPGTPPLELYLAGKKIADSFRFLDNTGYMALPAGEYQLDLVAGEGVGTTATLTLEEGVTYTAALARSKDDSLRVKVLVDTGSEIEDENAFVRFFHASPDIPTLNVLIDGKQVGPGLPFLERTGYFELPAQSTEFAFYAQRLAPEGISKQLPLEPGQAYTVGLTGLQADDSLSVMVWRDGPEGGEGLLRLGGMEMELDFEPFEPLGRMPAEEVEGHKAGSDIEAEVIRFGDDPSKPSVILRPSPELGSFHPFISEFDVGDRVEVEAVKIEKVPEDNLIALIVREVESGLEVAMAPRDLTFANQLDLVETIDPGSRFKAIVRRIEPESRTVYLSCLPLLEEDLQVLLGRHG